MSDPYIDLQIAGRLRLVECIGHGGIGSVYKAEQPDVDRHVAVKILQPKHLNRPDLLSRFRREARSMSHLSHPNTARVYFFGELDDGAMYIVMEYLEGRTLVQAVRREGAFDVQRLLRIAIPICGALEEAHQAGIIHRDLKPENIMLTRNGGIADFPKLLDFGLAKVSPREIHANSVYLTQDGAVFGTPEFMSPEQALGDPLDHRSDIYALGVVLYEALTGKLPFEVDERRDPLQMHVRGTAIPLNARLPDLAFGAPVAAAVMRAIARDPDQRFASATEFAAALAACTGELGPGLLLAHMPTIGSAPTPMRRRPPSQLAQGKRPLVGPPPTWLQWTALGLGFALAAVGIAALAVAWSAR